MNHISLLYSDTPTSDFENPVIIYLIYFIAFLIAAAITRSILSIPTFLNYQKSQLYLLAKIARQQNVPEAEIKSIFDKLELYEQKESDKPKMD